MQILIDTQVLIWFQLNHPNLGKYALDLIADKENTIYVFDISLYEIAIKQTIGKLSNFDVEIQDISSVAKADGFIFLPLTHDVITAYSKVPFYDSHRDPFDRLIIATAKVHDLAIISADDKFDLYRQYVSIISI